MADIKKQQVSKAAIAVAVGLLAFGFIYWKYVYSPFSVRYTTAVEKTRTIDSDMAKAASTAKKLETLTAEIDELRKKEQDMEKRLPKSKKIPDLIYTLMDISKKHNLSVNSMSPQKTIERPYYSESDYLVSMS
ncbi:MAG: type 4a pilus biogenesis protein PilO, partial [Elusimicrobia bacterium]|nr:type 4a pilus biogenesis protein PilO [Elusimicrobiota bacterium]